MISAGVDFRVISIAVRWAVGALNNGLVRRPGELHQPSFSRWSAGLMKPTQPTSLHSHLYATLSQHSKTGEYHDAARH